jgi:hypothetical protein
MDSKQLAKLIKVIVEAEVAKKHEQFLTKTFPKILEEEVNRRVKTLLEAKGGVVASAQVIEEIDPFERAEMLLQQERQQPQRQFTKNSAINEVLNQTQPFTAEQRKGSVGTKSVLDQFQQGSSQSLVQGSYDQTVTFNNQGAQLGLDGMRAQMEAQMGYDINTGGMKKTGLGVQTGLPGLDRILNRDNSELVKKFKR